ncbi:MAG: ribonuclease E/G, partial [Mycobacterium sp.]
MIDGGPSSELPGDSAQREDLPERLRVHSLARALGTTSKQVLDALAELDGRVRSAHSTVDRVDAGRVRDLLGSAPVPAVAAVAATETEAPVAADEPESRLMLETAVDRPEYMPLFVAPQPVERAASDDVDDSADSEDDDDLDADDDQSDRPANRRRRRGRRGRGRGRGEQNGTERGGEAGDGGDSDKSDAASADNADDDDSDDDADDSDTAEDDNGSGDGATKRRRRRRRRKSGSGDDNDES